MLCCGFAVCALISPDKLNPMAGRIRPTTFATLLLALTVSPLWADDENEVLRISGRTMGTTYQVKFLFNDPAIQAGASVDQLQQQIENRLDEVNRSMSTYLDDSEISRFNRSQSTEAFAVSDDFRQVAARALELHRLTQGKFDVTVGPLVRFWGFGGGEAPEQIPTQQEVENVLLRIGSRHLSLNETGIQKSVSGLEIDFSAIAKGFAVDEIGKVVARVADDFMVEIGGEVRTGGSNPASRRPWAIGIELPAENPLAAPGKIAARVELLDKALATSGDYRNFVLIENRKFQHTIDPTTGMPVDRGILSVSVVADDCMSADGLATGMMVQTLEETQSLCQQENIAAFVIYRNDDGNIAWWKSDSFPGEVLLDADPHKQQEAAADQGDNPLVLVLGTMIVFGLALSGMAIGVIMSNRQLKGSCGGLSAMNEQGEGDASPCSLCTKPASECSKRSEMEASESASTGA